MKKMTIGSWLSLVAAILTLVSLVMYVMNINAEGYFKGSSVTNLVLFTACAAALLVVAIVLNIANSSVAVKILGGIMQIAAPVLVAYSLIKLIASRVEGLGFIYFSNADVAKEVQTAANLSSAKGSITCMVLFGVALLVALIASFCSLSKEA